MIILQKLYNKIHVNVVLTLILFLNMLCTLMGGIQLFHSHKMRGGFPPHLCALHSVQPSFLLWGIELPSKFSRGGAWQDLNVQRGLLGKRGDFFQGGCNFHIKIKLKFEIFNHIKVYKQNYFSL